MTSLRACDPAQDLLPRGPTVVSAQIGSGRPEAAA